LHLNVHRGGHRSGEKTWLDWCHDAFPNGPCPKTIYNKIKHLLPERAANTPKPPKEIFIAAADAISDGSSNAVSVKPPVETPTEPPLETPVEAPKYTEEEPPDETLDEYEAKLMEALSEERSGEPSEDAPDYELDEFEQKLMKEISEEPPVKPSPSEESPCKVKKVIKDDGSRVLHITVPDYPDYVFEEPIN
jgi:hypothetical protein